MPKLPPAVQPDGQDDVGGGPGGVGGFTEVTALAVEVEDEAAGRGFEPDVTVLVVGLSSEFLLFDTSLNVTAELETLSV